MKFKVDQIQLLSLLSHVQGICEKRNTMPIVANALIVASMDGCLRLSATNLEVSFTSQIEADVEEQGSLMIDAKNIFKIVRELVDGPIEFETDENNWVNIHQNKSKFRIVGMNPESFPDFPHFETKHFFEVKASDFLEMIEKVIFSVSDDETRYHLNGVYFKRVNDNELKMVSTDGHRLSLIQKHIDHVNSSDALMNKGEGVIIPRKGLNEIKKLIESNRETFKIAIEGCQFIVIQGESILLVRLIEGRFPVYQKLIPKSFSKKIMFNREKLLGALKRISVLSDERSKNMTIDLLSNGVAKMSSHGFEQGSAKEEIEIDYNGEDFKINFNIQYMLDILNHVDEDVIHMELNNHLSPGIMKPHGSEDYKYLIMPMQL